MPSPAACGAHSRSFAAASAGRGDIRVALVRGEGTLAFSGGADISDFSSARSDASGAQSYDELVEAACAAVEGLPFPVVALVRGACVGAGAALAACCDLRVASEDAFFAIPAARLGLGYDPRGVARLVRAYGGHAARQLFFAADRLPARRAHELGAVDHLAPPMRWMPLRRRSSPASPRMPADPEGGQALHPRGRRQGGTAGGGARAHAGCQCQCGLPGRSPRLRRKAPAALQRKLRMGQRRRLRPGGVLPMVAPALGRSQVVRQRILIPPSPGSNPGAPARPF